MSLLLLADRQVAPPHEHMFAYGGDGNTGSHPVVLHTNHQNRWHSRSHRPPAWTAAVARNVRPPRRRAVITGHGGREPRGLQSAPHASASQARATSWLCRDDFDRERMLDMEDRIRPARRRTFAVLAVSIAAVCPWLGWWPRL